MYNNVSVLQLKGCSLVEYQPEYPLERNTAPLDPNHTHFILADDGTVKHHGGEIDLRSNLEQCIHKKLKTITGDSMTFVHVAIVNVLLSPLTARPYAKRGICRRHVSVCVCVCVCVCLSVVCLSVTLGYCIKTAKRRVMQIIPHDSPGFLVFRH